MSYGFFKGRQYRYWRWNGARCRAIRYIRYRKRYNKNGMRSLNGVNSTTGGLA